MDGGCQYGADLSTAMAGSMWSGKGAAAASGSGESECSAGGSAQAGASMAVPLQGDCKILDEAVSCSNFSNCGVEGSCCAQVDLSVIIKGRDGKDQVASETAFVCMPTEAESAAVRLGEDLFDT